METLTSVDLLDRSGLSSGKRYYAFRMDFSAATQETLNQGIQDVSHACSLPNPNIPWALGDGCILVVYKVRETYLPKANQLRDRMTLPYSCEGVTFSAHGFDDLPDLSWHNTESIASPRGEDEEEEEDEEEDEEEEEDEDEEYNKDTPKPLTCTNCGHDVDPDDVTAYVDFERAATSTHYEVDDDGDYIFYVDLDSAEPSVTSFVIECPRCGGEGDEDLLDGCYRVR